MCHQIRAGSAHPPTTRIGKYMREPAVGAGWRISVYPVKVTSARYPAAEPARKPCGLTPGRCRRGSALVRGIEQGCAGRSPVRPGSFGLLAVQAAEVRYVIDMLRQPGRFSEVFPLQVFPSPSQFAQAGRPVLAAYRDRVTPLTYSEPAPSDEQRQAKADPALEELAVHMAEARLAHLAGDGCSPERDANEERVQTAGSLSPPSEELDALLRARKQVERQVEQVEGRLAYLRKFERNYRTKLQAFAEWQLRELYAPEMRQQAEERIRELHERTAAAGVAGVSALVLHQDGTYEVLPLGPGN